DGTTTAMQSVRGQSLSMLRVSIRQYQSNGVAQRGTRNPRTRSGPCRPRLLLIECVAGRQRFAVWIQRRASLIAGREAQRAAWMKMAARRRVDRVWNFTGDRHSLLAAHVDVGNRVEQHPAVRMTRVGKE